LLEAGLLHGGALTVTGRSIAEEASRDRSAGPGGGAASGQPIKATGGLVVLKGNLAPEGCVVKSPATPLEHTGPARVFDSEEAAFAAVEAGTIRAGDVVVIRYEGPAAPRHREMLAVTAALVGAGLGDSVALLNRRPLLGCHARADGGHVAPRRRAAARLPRCAKAIASPVDITARELRLDVADNELQRRLTEWAPPAPVRVRRHGQVRPLVSSASEGAVTG